MATATQQAAALLDAATSEGKLSPSAVENIRTWLTLPQYANYVPELVTHLTEKRWKQLDDVFWTIIPFGTGGRRGVMYPIGSNAINDRTIGESAQGLADYVKTLPLQDRDTRSSATTVARLSCAIAYDTRHRSRHFAELCAEVMVANGFHVYFLDGFRSTPELSFAVRYCRCDCGIMVTASHNPPSDNAVKAYWHSGGQLLPPHDSGVINCVMRVTDIKRRPFDEAVATGDVKFCQKEVDREYVAAVASNAMEGPREMKLVYSTLHGVGASNVAAVLAADGFKNITLFAPHAEPDGDFPNVPGHSANPENPAVFDSIIEFAQSVGADVAFASDPDSDRLGCAAPVSMKAKSHWATLTGNQIGALLTDFVCERRKTAGTLTSKSYIVKTLVTTELIRRIADSYGVRTEGDLQVGFKYIGGLMDEIGPDDFLLGAEESYGFLVGQYARDKDAAAGALLLAELAAQCKSRKQTLHEKLDALYWQFGCHDERQISIGMPGSEGMRTMQLMMDQLRTNPPATLGGMNVVRVRDFQNLTEVSPDGKRQSFTGPMGNMVMIDLDLPGTYVAVRPSGTEPKVKFYIFTYEPAELLHNLDATKGELRVRIDELTAGLKQFAVLR